MSTFSQFSGAQESLTSDGRTILSVPVTRPLYQPTVTASQKLRVAAYARVSTDKEEQVTSYRAQVDYYTHYIQGRADWEYAGLYTDEGISATSTAKREGFNQMVADALEGKFDRLITKSVSRFARNTVDSLTTIREFKTKGIGVTFEKENIDTLDSKGELLITLMSSLAQEESRSISENVTWGQRKRFSDGKVTVPFGQFLGYDRGENGELVLNEEEAKTVRLIYGLYLDGKSISAIARCLMENVILSPAGKKTWQTTTIRSILTNEKYRGDALLQKSFCIDFLTKKMKKNEGEVQSFYVKGDHDPIVSGEVFELVQCEMQRRQASGRRIGSGSIFSGKLVCGQCGGTYGSKVWNSNNKYRKVIWQCNHKFGQKNKRVGNGCTTPNLSEDQIKTAFVSMLNGMLESRDEILAFYDELIRQLADTSVQEKEKAALEKEGIKVNGILRDWIKENARHAMSQEIYRKRQDELEAQLETVRGKLAKVEETILRRKMKSEYAARMVEQLHRDGLVVTFDEGMFGAFVDSVTVYCERMVFALKDGSERSVAR